ncbi:MAG: DNA adenine methylase [Gammaproteobacteria bacterium]|nr:DNA adenine methylase [Gammaproteobacteria bacterium]
MAYLTPLRYPGGKGKFAPYLKQLIAHNKLHDAHYVEPFCGGAGLAIDLLSAMVVDTIHLNDFDRAVAAFWKSAVYRSEEFCERILTTPVTADTWHAQREIHRAKATAEELDLGFATFFLNRTNRSGILEGGMIGGKDQSGEWKLDARYTKDALVKRVMDLGRARSRIFVHNLDAVDFLRQVVPTLPRRKLTYLDPPYVEKGPRLYMNHFQEADHTRLAQVVIEELQGPWLVSYDEHPLIRRLYADFEQRTMDLHYSAKRERSQGKEVMVFSNHLQPPDMAAVRSRHHQPWATAETEAT